MIFQTVGYMSIHLSLKERRNRKLKTQMELRGQEMADIKKLQKQNTTDQKPDWAKLNKFWRYRICTVLTLLIYQYWFGYWFYFVSILHLLNRTFCSTYYYKKVIIHLLFCYFCSRLYFCSNIIIKYRIQVDHDMKTPADKPNSNLSFEPIVLCWYGNPDMRLNNKYKRSIHLILCSKQVHTLPLTYAQIAVSRTAIVKCWLGHEATDQYTRGHPTSTGLQTSTGQKTSI